MPFGRLFNHVSKRRCLPCASINGACFVIKRTLASRSPASSRSATAASVWPLSSRSFTAWRRRSARLLAENVSFARDNRKSLNNGWYWYVSSVRKSSSVKQLLRLNSERMRLAWGCPVSLWAIIAVILGKKAVLSKKFCVSLSIFSKISVAKYANMSFGTCLPSSWRSIHSLFAFSNSSTSPAAHPWVVLCKWRVVSFDSFSCAWSPTIPSDSSNVKRSVFHPRRAIWWLARIRIRIGGG